jgi:hypothetical protein
MNRAVYTCLLLGLAGLAGCGRGSTGARHHAIAALGGDGAGTVKGQRLDRARKVDFLAQLYLGASLPPREIAALAGLSPDAVVADLVTRPAYNARFQARLAAFAAGAGDDAPEGAAPASAPLDGMSPDSPLTEVLARVPGVAAEGGVCPGGDLVACFVDWLSLEASPGSAPGDVAQATYRQLLDAYARVSDVQGGTTP